MAKARIFHFEKLEIEGTVAGYNTIQEKECWEEFFLPGAVTQGDSDWFHCQECDIRVSWQK